MKKMVSILLLVLNFTVSKSQEVSIIPQPANMVVEKGNFNITANTQIVLAGSGLENPLIFKRFLARILWLQIENNYQGKLSK